MHYDKRVIATISRLQARIEQEYAQDGDAREALMGRPMKIDITMIITLIGTLLPLIANCRKQPPAPTPVPDPAKLMGITDQAWKDAHDSKWTATEAWNGRRYNAATLNNTAREIAAKEGIKMRAARPKAVAVLDAARNENMTDMALTMTQIAQ